MKINITLMLLLLVVCSSCNKIKDGKDVIRLMKKEYNNGYLKNFTFSQAVTQYQNDSIIHKAVWHEAYVSPGKLIIKFDDFNSGNGYVFKHDTVYVLKDNEVVKKQRDIHDLLVLGFDVYEQPPASADL